MSDDDEDHEELRRVETAQDAIESTTASDAVGCRRESRRAQKKWRSGCQPRQTTATTRPTMSEPGTGPQIRLSQEIERLSPMTKKSFFGTCARVIGWPSGVSCRQVRLVAAHVAPSACC